MGMVFKAEIWDDFWGNSKVNEDFQPSKKSLQESFLLNCKTKIALLLRLRMHTVTRPAISIRDPYYEVSSLRSFTPSVCLVSTILISRVSNTYSFEFGKLTTITSKLDPLICTMKKASRNCSVLSLRPWMDSVIAMLIHQLAFGLSFYELYKISRL